MYSTFYVPVTVLRHVGAVTVLRERRDQTDQGRISQVNEMTYLKIQGQKTTWNMFKIKKNLYSYTVQ